MKRLNSFPIIIVLLLGLSITGCKQTLVISKVNYSQPVESVLQPNQEGFVKDAHNDIQFNILPLQYAETQDTSSISTKEIRMIRGREGYYYITAPHYKYVYVMIPERESLKLEKKILISQEGVSEPVFNQRKPYVQLLNRSTGQSYALSVTGVAKNKTPKDNKEVQ